VVEARAVDDPREVAAGHDFDQRMIEQLVFSPSATELPDASPLAYSPGHTTALQGTYAITFSSEERRVGSNRMPVCGS